MRRHQSEPAPQPHETLRVLVVDIAPWEGGTARPQKLATSLTQVGTVEYLGLARSGRSRSFGVPKRRSREPSGVVVSNLRSLTPASSRHLLASVFNVLVYSTAISGLAVAMLRTRADVCLVENPVLLGPGALHKSLWRSILVLDARERPASIRLRGSLASWYARVDRWVLKALRSQIELIVTVCDSHADDFEALGITRLLVVHNAPEHTSNHEQLPVPALPLRIAVAGTLMPNRGYEELIEGVSIASRAGVQVTLNIAGPASRGDLARLVALSEQCGAADNVHFHGVLRREDVGSFYAANHVVAALYGSGDRANDSLPNKLFEAMSAARPVLVNQPEASRIVRAEQCGWSLPSISPSDIAEWMAGIAGDVDALSTLGLNGRAAFEREYNWSEQAQRLTRVLADVLGNSQTSALRRTGASALPLWIRGRGRLEQGTSA